VSVLHFLVEYLLVGGSSSSHQGFLALNGFQGFASHKIIRLLSDADQLVLELIYCGDVGRDVHLGLVDHFPYLS